MLPPSLGSLHVSHELGNASPSLGSLHVSHELGNENEYTYVKCNIIL